VIAYIDAHRDEFGVEPICRVLQVAPSTYYAAKTRPPAAPAVRDDQLKAEIVRVFEANYRCYGVVKVWRQLRREGLAVARCTVARLMRQLGPPLPHHPAPSRRAHPHRGRPTTRRPPQRPRHHPRPYRRCAPI
jgi:transposase InsO family protein